MKIRASFYIHTDACTDVNVGMGIGFLVVLLMIWMQTRTPREMLRRMMALLMLASTGLMPISPAAAGAISKWNLTLLFAIPGALVVLMTAWIHPDLTGFSESLIAAQAQAEA